LCDLQREALRHYKRQYLQTVQDGAKMMGEEGRGLMEREVVKVAGWTLADLPQMVAHDVSRVPLTKSVRRWIEAKHGDLPETEAGRRALLGASLDNGDLKAAELKKMAGRGPLRGKVRYDQWWVTALIEGMISFIASSVQRDHAEITVRDVAGWPFPKIAEAARKVEGITSADMGNT
ncbi:MAG: hypothetical protein V3W28_02965, partial [Thermoplasmata archaeon]